MIYLLRNQQLEEADLKKAYAAIIGFTTPVLQEISWLGKEMSASHVIRSSISLVLGLPLVAEKKGKMSKHKHSIGYSEPMESLLVPGHFFISEKKAYSMPPAVQSKYHIVLSLSININDLFEHCSCDDKCSG
ncbi:hypothetical protein EON65_28380 [archaeon]|nr:MAG: hypothetical protein EON65_28380 [archaeon]